jgi:hypothetical protein
VEYGVSAAQQKRRMKMLPLWQENCAKKERSAKQ